VGDTRSPLRLAAPPSPGGVRHVGIRKDRETDMLDKLFTAFLRRADEGTLSRLLVEVSVVLATGRSNGTNALREAATGSGGSPPGLSSTRKVRPS
jgi:hypothetical protein